MKDFIGKDLNIGDVVAVNQSEGRRLIKATVKSFTKKQVRLIYFNRYDCLIELLIYPEHVIKITQAEDNVCQIY